MTGTQSTPGESSGSPFPPPPQRVLEKQVYRGPNVFGYEPMIRFQLDLGALEEFPSNRLPGFTDRLLELLPSLETHGCAYREPGGFIRRLRDGTWLGHVTEHVAPELQTQAGSRVTYGKTRSVRGRPGVDNVLYTSREERLGLIAGAVALRLVQSLLPPELQGVEGVGLLLPDGVGRIDPGAPFDFAGELDELRRLARRYTLGPTTQSLVSEAERRGIPYLRLDDQSLVQLGCGRSQRQIRASITSLTPHIATMTASDKKLTKKLLLSPGLSDEESAVSGLRHRDRTMWGPHILRSTAG